MDILSFLANFLLIPDEYHTRHTVFLPYLFVAKIAYPILTWFSLYVILISRKVTKVHNLFLYRFMIQFITITIIIFITTFFVLIIVFSFIKSLVVIINISSIVIFNLLIFLVPLLCFFNFSIVSNLVLFLIFIVL